MLILASQSPRRRQLLDLLEIPYQILVQEIDETPLPNETVIETVQRLAKAKAYAVNHNKTSSPILAADTIVVLEDHGKPQILGKPRSPEEAQEMLIHLRNRSHQVMSAIALMNPNSGEFWGEYLVSNVLMRDYTDKEIDAYIASGDPFDKAGAYAIQHANFHPVRQLDGCYTNVMGLPLCKVAQLLSRVGFQTTVNIPQICAKMFSVECPGHLESPKHR
ncbi:MAG: Maf family protein [Anaerolineales bacterium]